MNTKYFNVCIGSSVYMVSEIDLRVALAKANLNQRQFAKAFGYSDAMVSEVLHEKERSNPLIICMLICQFIKAKTMHEFKEIAYQTKNIAINARHDGKTISQVFPEFKSFLEKKQNILSKDQDFGQKETLDAA